MKFEGNISISRDSRDKINIRIEDDVSGIRFIDVQMTLEDFAFAITGLSCQAVKGEVRGLENVGKTKVRESRSTLQVEELKYKSRQEITEWLKSNCQEEGWILDTYLGSQSSFSHDSQGNMTIHYSVHKYVDVIGAEE